MSWHERIHRRAATIGDYLPYILRVALRWPHGAAASAKCVRICGRREATKRYSPAEALERALRRHV